MAQTNLGAILAEAWDKHLTLEGREYDSSYLYAYLSGKPQPYRPDDPPIKTGMWQGERYWKVWNYRTGEREWVKQGDALTRRPPIVPVLRVRSDRRVNPRDRRR